MTPPERGAVPAHETRVPANTGWATVVRKGQHLRVRGWTIVDLVALDAHDVRHRFDQARTKTNQSTLFVTTGHALYSKSNVVMMVITEDTFAGRHDLQKGMCSRSVHELALRSGRLREKYGRDLSFEQLPDHGCWENLSAALASYDVPAEDIPSPLNLFQDMSIDVASGHLTNSGVRPTGDDGASVTLRAELDCIVGVSACPDLSVGGRDVFVRVT